MLFFVVIVEDRQISRKLAFSRHIRDWTGDITKNVLPIFDLEATKVKLESNCNLLP